MRYLAVMTMFLVTVFFTFSCKKVFKSDADQPDKIAIKFMQALSVADIKKASDYCSQNTKTLFDMLKNMPPIPQKSSNVGDFKQATCSDISAGKKRCVVCCGEGNLSVPVTLIQENKKWVVDLDKEELEKKSQNLPDGGNMPDRPKRDSI